MVSGGNVSSSMTFLIDTLKSLMMICARLKSPERGSGMIDGP